MDYLIKHLKESRGEDSEQVMFYRPRDNRFYRCSITAVKGGGGIGSAFHALTYDPNTYEMLGVKTGTGDLAAIHADTLYAPDYRGVYQAFPADAPVWAGGRCELADGPGSAVTGVFANSSPGGALLPEMPYLQYYPAAENSCLHSRDLTNAAWTIVAGTPITSYDQVGLDGSANSASRIEDNESGAISAVRASVAIPDDSSIHVMRVFVKKDNDGSRFPEFKFILNGGNLHRRIVQINTKTGEHAQRAAVGAGAYEVSSMGAWWVILMQVTNNTTGNTVAEASVSPAFSSTLGGGGVASLAGNITVGNVEVHLNKTIAEVRGLGPIFTTSAAVSVAAITYDNNVANHAESGCYYMDVLTNAADNILDGFLAVVGSNFQLNDGANTSEQPWTTNTVHKVGIAFHTGQMAINVDGVWDTDRTYDNTLLSGALDYFRAGSASSQIRDVLRYDAADYASAKSIIDGLMGVGDSA